MKEFLHILARFNLSALFKDPSDNPWVGLFRYCFAGGVAFLIDFGCYFFLSWIGIHYLVSGLIAFSLSFLVNFFISRRLIFQQKNASQKIASEVASVLVIALIGLLTTEILLVVCVHFMRLGYLISKVIVSVVVLLWNYLGRRYFVYRNTPIPMKRQLKLLLKLSFIVILCSILGMAALIAVYCIPTASIRENLADSANLLEQEGLYPSLDSNVSSQLDNFTDALMLHIAGYQTTESPFVEATLVNRLECKDAISPLDSLVADAHNTEREMVIIDYSRYWHGYLVFLKPLLTLFNYGEIRTINTILQCVLITILFALLIKKRLYLFTIPTLFLIGFQGMPTTVLSLQFSSVFYIYSIGMIILLLCYEKWKDTAKLLIYFAILGACTAYLDLLTYPLVTFGVPIALLLVLEKNQSLFGQLKTIVCSGITWLFSYAGMWVGKGVIGTLITQKNIFKKLLGAVINRSLLSTENISFPFVMRNNIATFIHSYFFIFAVLFCCVLFVILILRSCKRKHFSHLWNNLGFVLICFAPVCWYMVLKQHSYIHYWFTYRELLITLFSGIVMLVKMYVDEKQMVSNSP